jgi:RNA polymerase sigma-70 factor, ECF subfamily
MNLAASPAATAAPSASFHRHLEEHAVALLGRARHLTRDPDAAADLVQDTFERALRSPPRVLEGGNVRGWLFVILRNLYIDRCRAGRQHRDVAFDEAAVARASAPAGDEVEEAQPPWMALAPESVRALVHRLPEHLRLPLELSVDGHRYEDIAALLQLTTITVGTRIHRARKRLRAILLEEAGRPEREGRTEIGRPGTLRPCAARPSTRRAPGAAPAPVARVASPGRRTRKGAPEGSFSMAVGL